MSWYLNLISQGAVLLLTEVLSNDQLSPLESVSIPSLSLILVEILSIDYLFYHSLREVYLILQLKRTRVQMKLIFCCASIQFNSKNVFLWHTKLFAFSRPAKEFLLTKVFFFDQLMLSNRITKFSLIGWPLFNRMHIDEFTDRFSIFSFWQNWTQPQR